MRILTLILACLICPLVASDATAQWAVELTGGVTEQAGTFTAPCACQYTGGTGIAFSLTSDYRALSLGALSLGLGGGLSYERLNSAHDYLSSSDAIDLHDSMSLALYYVVIEPVIRYDLFQSSLFLQLSPRLSVLAGSHFYQRKSFLNGDHWGDGSTDSTWENGPLESSTPFRLSGRLTAGYRIPVAGHECAPAISIDLPITTDRSADATGIYVTRWSLMAVTASLILWL